jgi:hypothetical protein
MPTLLATHLRCDGLRCAAALRAALLGRPKRAGPSPAGLRLLPARMPDSPHCDPAARPQVFSFYNDQLNRPLDPAEPVSSLTLLLNVCGSNVTMTPAVRGARAWPGPGRIAARHCPGLDGRCRACSAEACAQPLLPRVINGPSGPGAVLLWSRRRGRRCAAGPLARAVLRHLLLRGEPLRVSGPHAAMPTRSARTPPQAPLLVDRPAQRANPAP